MEKKFSDLQESLRLALMHLTRASFLLAELAFLRTRRRMSRSFGRRKMKHGLYLRVIQGGQES